MIDAFEGQIASAVESTLTKKLGEGILQLDSFLQGLPKEILVDDIAALNVTFVGEPSLSNASIGFDINGLFISRKKASVGKYYHKSSESSLFCTDQSKMVEISLEEAVFNSASALYYNVSKINKH